MCDKIKLKIEEYVDINYVLVSCQNKTGLVSNIDSNGDIVDGIPSNGILGLMSLYNKKLVFVSSGNTYKMIQSAGLNVVHMSEHTKFPDMPLGLVTSIHPKIHGGILSSKYNKAESEFVYKNDMVHFDTVIVNFEPIPIDEIANNTVEEMRNLIDIGGVTMCNSARKAFTSTVLMTSLLDYKLVADELKIFNGKVSLNLRLQLAKNASTIMELYAKSAEKLIDNITIENVHTSYEVR